MMGQLFWIHTETILMQQMGHFRVVCVREANKYIYIKRHFFSDELRVVFLNRIFATLMRQNIILECVWRLSANRDLKNS